MTRAPATHGGIYITDPDGAIAALGESDVFCDMGRDGGGWTLVRVGLNSGSVALRNDGGPTA